MTVTIVMGQAWRDRLVAAVKQVGGRVHSHRLDETSTSVIVSASFRPVAVGSIDTPAKVQDALWRELGNGPSIAVVPR